MSTLVSRAVTKLLSRQCTTCPLPGFDAHLRHSHWFPSVMTLKTSPFLRAERAKKKKVDPKREQQRRERLKKKIKRLEKVPAELIPIDDFTPVRYRDEIRVRTEPQLPFEESERRALLLKEWSRYKQSQHKAEMEAISQALEAQREALEELKLVSEELYCAALKPDPVLLPLHHQGPSYTPPKDNYEPPEGKYNDTTKVHTQ